MDVIHDWNPSKFVAHVATHKSKHPLIVFDVDLTLIGGFDEKTGKHPERPGAALTIKSLVADGWTVVLWSGGGKGHATDIAAELGIGHLVSKIFSKPDFPIQNDAIISLLGRMPDVTVDDDLGEAIQTVEFIHCSSFWGQHIMRETEPLADWEIALLDINIFS